MKDCLLRSWFHVIFLLSKRHTPHPLLCITSIRKKKTKNNLDYTCLSVLIIIMLHFVEHMAIHVEHDMNSNKTVRFQTIQFSKSTHLSYFFFKFHFKQFGPKWTFYKYWILSTSDRSIHCIRSTYLSRLVENKHIRPNHCHILVVAEWLRRWTANQLGFPRVSSNHIFVVRGFSLSDPNKVHVSS